MLRATQVLHCVRLHIIVSGKWAGAAGPNAHGRLQDRNRHLCKLQPNRMQQCVFLASVLDRTEEPCVPACSTRQVTSLKECSARCKHICVVHSLWQ